MAATLLWWLAQNAVLASILAGLVALACRLGRFRPAVQHALWLLVLLKLVTPPLPLWSWTPPVAWHPTDARPEQPAPVQFAAIPDEREPMSPTWAADAPADGTATEIVPIDPAPIDDNPDPGRADQSIGATPAPATDCPEIQVADRQPNRPERDWLEKLASVVWWTWLTGLTAVAGLQLVRLLRFRRLLAEGRPPPRELSREVKELSARLGVRPPQVTILPGIGSPLICGLGRPLLLWPVALDGQMPLECQRAVIVHELAHLRRRDHWVAWLQMLAGCLWWWNPLYWYVCWQLGRAAELACDAWVIGTLPDARRSYAEALLAVAQMMSATAAPTPALGMSGASRHDFKRRLTMIMCERVPCRLPVFGLVVLGLLALTVLPGWSLGQRPAGPAVAQTQSQPPAGADANKTPVALDFGFQPPAAAKPAPTEQDRKLQELERKVQAILKEVQALRGAKTSRPVTMTPYQIADQPLSNALGTANVQQWSVFGQVADSQSVTLTRTTYKLPKEKAEALSAFLRQHVKARVLESKVDGDSLIVTTTPEAQRTIGQFITLMKSKPSGDGPMKPITPAQP